MDQGLIVNPFASSVFDDVVQPGAQFVQMGYDYVFNLTMAGGVTYTNQVVSIDRDSDFVLRAVQIVNVTSPLGALQIMDNQGVLFQNDYENFGAFLLGGLAVPYVINPGRLFAAGGRILLNLQEQSGSDNTIQIVFRGQRRQSLIQKGR